MASISSATKLNYRDYCAIPDDGNRHEIIDGVHFMNPAPSTYHQTVSRKIQFQLFSQIELNNRGVVFDAPTDLQLSDHDIIQPDLIVILQQHRTIVTPTKIKGVPDLVVEILSPSTEENDRDRKFKLYSQAGIPEYWIVDPEEHHVLQYGIRSGAYELLGKESTEIVFLQLIDDVRVDLTQVW